MSETFYPADPLSACTHTLDRARSTKDCPVRGGVRARDLFRVRFRVRLIIGVQGKALRSRLSFMVTVEILSLGQAKGRASHK